MGDTLSDRVIATVVSKVSAMVIASVIESFGQIVRLRTSWRYQDTGIPVHRRTTIFSPVGWINKESISV